MLPISRGDRRCREIDEQAHAIDRRDRDHHRKRQPDPIGVPMNQNARHSTMQQVLNQLGNREKEISNMLPQDLPIERFQANVLNALRNTPSILDATAASIVKAYMKAAYDGLRIDGKEAAIVVHENTYGQGQNQRKVKEAEYFPMAFGLIQQVLRGGGVVAIEEIGRASCRDRGCQNV